MVDIIFVSVPYTESTEPAMAPALLKAVAVQYGYSAVALDLNIEIINRISTHSKKQDLITFFEVAKERPELADDIEEIIDYSVDRILSYNPKIIGLSLLTYKSQLFSLWLLIKLKMAAPDIKIVIGGSGIKDFIASSNNTFCEEMLSLKLIDYYIIGDGEIAIIEFLKENFTYPGINSLIWQQILNLDDFAYPDYSDYNFNQYPDKLIPITDSRGCVRACKFCDIIEHWKKYVYRSAESVFKEMLCQIDRYKICSFTMRNSLTNGNTKEFKKLLLLIGEYNKFKTYDQQIKWQGYFIIRERTQHSEEMFEQIQKSNGTLWLGVESVIEHVRHAMGKKFSNNDIDYHLEMTQKYQIPTLLLIMTGNPTETRADYEFTKRWFKDRYQYAGNSVYNVYLSISSILPGTEWARTQDEMNLQLGKYPSIWINQDLNISTEERTQYWDELLEICAPYMKDVPSDSQNEKNQNSAIAIMKSAEEVS
jgi:hypothetical protein